MENKNSSKTYIIDGVEVISPLPKYERYVPPEFKETIDAEFTVLNDNQELAVPKQAYPEATTETAIAFNDQNNPSKVAVACKYNDSTKDPDANIGLNLDTHA